MLRCLERCGNVVGLWNGQADDCQGRIIRATGDELTPIGDERVRHLMALSVIIADTLRLYDTHATHAQVEESIVDLIGATDKHLTANLPGAFRRCQQDCPAPAVIRKPSYSLKGVAIKGLLSDTVLQCSNDIARCICARGFSIAKARSCFLIILGNKPQLVP